MGFKGKVVLVTGNIMENSLWFIKFKFNFFSLKYRETNLRIKFIIISNEGASSGIGAGAAEHLAKLGAQVAIVGRNAERTNQVAERIKKSGASVLAIVADVTKDAERIINETIKKFGQLDVLVNNAGVVTQDNAATIGFAEFERVFNTNVRSVIELTKLAVPHLEKTAGNIVNISSVAGLKAIPNVTSYCISKAALDQFTKCSALDLAPKKIRVRQRNRYNGQIFGVQY